MCDKNQFWNKAGAAGLVLGLVSIIYMFGSERLSRLGTDKTSVAMLISVVNFLLWAAKFAGCILLMKYFMKRFAASDGEISNADTFKWGMAVAVLSAILYAGFSLAYTLYINPDMYKAALDKIMEGYASMLDSNSIAALDAMIDKMPVYTFFGNLIYCSLFGTVLSAVLSRNIPSTNPFEKQ